MRDINFSGLWWLYNNQDQAVAGVLTFSAEEGLLLSLIGTFGSEEDLLSMKAEVYPIVVGITSNGKSVTLQNCSTKNFRMNSNGFPTETLRASVAFIGYAFNDTEDIKFSSCAVEYTHLEEWVNRSGFTWSLPIGATDNDEYIVKYKKPEEVSAKTKNVVITITTTLQYRPSSFHQELHQHTFFRFQSDDSLSFNDWLNKYLVPIQDFMAIATDTPNSANRVILYQTDREVEDSQHQIRVETYFQPVRLVQANKVESLQASLMLLSLADVDDFSRVINYWFNNLEKQGIIWQLFANMINDESKSKFTVSYFLDVVQIIDAYHNIVFPEENKRTTLTSKIERLLAVSGDAIADIPKSTSALARQITMDRNYYTHFDTTLSSTKSDTTTLFWNTQWLILIVQSCFLREIGMNTNKIGSIIKGRQRHQAVLNYFSSNSPK